MSEIEKMDALHASELLYRHNIWRRGDDTYDMANPKELGIALDMAVKALRQPDYRRVIEKIIYAAEGLKRDFICDESDEVLNLAQKMHDSSIDTLIAILKEAGE